MRLVFTAFGTTGDVEPILQLASAVRRQGDEVVLVLSPFFAPRARQLGLEVRTVGPSGDPTAIAGDPKMLDPMNVWKHAFAPLVPQHFEAVRAILAEAPTAGVVNHAWCFGGALAAESCGLPWAMVSLAPATWFSCDEPCLLDHRVYPQGLHRLLIRGLVKPVIRWFFDPALQQTARAAGLSRVPGRFWAAQRRATLNLGLWSSQWRGPAGDDPENATIVGFPSLPPPARLAPEVERFMAHGEPPIVVGFGSALPSIAGPHYRHLALACAELKLRALLVGALPEAAQGLGSTVMTIDRAPYAALFPRARLVVHHGGIGSTAEGLRAGRPTLVISLGNDQHDNGYRVQLLGGGKWLPRQRATPSAIRSALCACLEEAVAEKAARIAVQLAAEEAGEVRAAREIRHAFGAAG